MLIIRQYTLQIIKRRLRVSTQPQKSIFLFTGSARINFTIDKSKMTANLTIKFRDHFAGLILRGPPKVLCVFESLRYGVSLSLSLSLSLSRLCSQPYRTCFILPDAFSLSLRHCFFLTHASQYLCDCYTLLGVVEHLPCDDDLPTTTPPCMSART